MLESLGLQSTPASSKTAWATLPDGWHTMGEIRDALAAATGGSETDLSLFFALGPTRQGRRYRSLSLQFASTEDEDETVEVRIRLIRGGRDYNPHDETASACVQLLGTATLTIGAGTGAGAGIVTAEERLADTIEWVGEAVAALLEYITDTDPIGDLLHSPADDTPAILHIPDAGNAACVHVEILNANAGKATRAIGEVWT